MQYVCLCRTCNQGKRSGNSETIWVAFIDENSSAEFADPYGTCLQRLGPFRGVQMNDVARGENWDAAKAGFFSETASQHLFWRCHSLSGTRIVWPRERFVFALEIERICRHMTAYCPDLPGILAIPLVQVFLSEPRWRLSLQRWCLLHSQRFMSRRCLRWNSRLLFGVRPLPTLCCMTASHDPTESFVPLQVQCFMHPTESMLGEWCVL